MPIAREFDEPIFKVLAKNDTGEAPGHQGGFVVPKDLEDFFPLLRNETSFARPTVDAKISADLFDGPDFIDTVETRYQYQTWGGERSPERRVTGNIAQLRNLARGDDILLIQRGVDVEDHYRFTLIRATHPDYRRFMQSFGGSRWGIVSQDLPPVKETSVIEAVEEIAAEADAAFSLFDDEAGEVESRVRRIARSRAFQRVVRMNYADECGFCGEGLRHPDGRSELEAAHIVSRAKKGSDDPRNGLLLCRGHHWAFDNGLIGISDMFELIVPAVVAADPRNSGLVGLAGRGVGQPIRQELRPHLDALAWHREHVLLN